MGLNETLDRLKKEREERERKDMEIMERIASLPLPNEEVKPKLDPHIREYAERIFFDRMLKDINNGMSEPKIDALIERSVMIATRLAGKLYAK